MNEQKTGTWYARHGDAQCSECGIWQKYIYDADNWQNYCGHCGARMTALKSKPPKNKRGKQYDMGDDRRLDRLVQSAARRMARRYSGGQHISHVYVDGIRYVYNLEVQKGGEYGEH